MAQVYHVRRDRASRLAERPFSGPQRTHADPTGRSTLATTADSLTLALEHHMAGRVAEAERLYTHILDRDPRNADALYLLGVLAGQSGRADQAVALIGRAMALRPDAAELPSALGRVLDDAELPQAAARAYRRALALKPDFPGCWSRLGVLLGRLGEGRAARAAVARAAALDPGRAETRAHLALLARVH